MEHISYAKADRVAEKLSQTLGRAAWLRGIGIEADNPHNFVVTVRVAREADIPQLPGSIDGVTIRVVRRGLAQALSAAAR
jgi:hypothetical protein